MAHGCEGVLRDCNGSQSVRMVIEFECTLICPQIRPLRLTMPRRARYERTGTLAMGTLALTKGFRSAILFAFKRLAQCSVPTGPGDGSFFGRTE